MPSIVSGTFSKEQRERFDGLMKRILGEEPESFEGLGRVKLREMKKRWRTEGSGLSLKQWARQNNLVGDAAQAWLENKKNL